MCAAQVVQSSVKQIVAHGKVVRPALGISFAPDQSSEQLGVKGGARVRACKAWEGGAGDGSKEPLGARGRRQGIRAAGCERYTSLLSKRGREGRLVVTAAGRER